MACRMLVGWPQRPPTRDICATKKLIIKGLDFNLESGDRVLLKNLGLKGKHKPQNLWCDIPYIIVKKMPNIPVYKVKPQNGKDEAKTLHRDHLLPTGGYVQIPLQNNTEDVHDSSSAQVVSHKHHERAKTDHSQLVECGTETE